MPALAHDDIGHGTTVLLLHSGVADRRMWVPMVRELADGLRVVAPDLRGFGDTPMPTGGAAYGDAADVADLLDHLEIGPVTVVGSSLGGRVALELAVTRPDLVGSLLLLCPAWRGLPPSGRALAFDAEEIRLVEAGALDEAAALNARTWLGPEADGPTRDLVATMQRHAYDLQLATPDHPGSDEVPVDPKEVGAPTLVVVGEKDVDHAVAVGVELAARIPDVRLVRLPWAGHLPALERPGETAALVDSWVREVAAR